MTILDADKARRALTEMRTAVARYEDAITDEELQAQKDQIAASAMALDRYADLGRMLAAPETAATAPPEPQVDPNLNALKWIAHLAAVHYMGRAFDPLHMKGLADLALTVIAGDDLPDFDEAMAAARRAGRKQWEELGFADDGVALVDADELEKVHARERT